MNDAQVEAETVRKGLSAPRVTLDELNANIVHTEIVKHVSHAGQILRWAVLTTRSGFAVVGNPSVAASAANDDEAIGASIAIDNSRSALWPLMGYALKEQQAAAPSNHLERVQLEANELQGRIDRLGEFSNSDAFAALDQAEQSRLRLQHELMIDYADVLAARLKAAQS